MRLRQKSAGQPERSLGWVQFFFYLNFERLKTSTERVELNKNEQQATDIA